LPEKAPLLPWITLVDTRNVEVHSVDENGRFAWIGSWRQLKRAPRKVHHGFGGASADHK
jgi:hypothetical protein